MIINMAYSLQQEFALLPAAVQEAWLAEQSLETLKEIERGEWWWVARSAQIPPSGPWHIYLYLAGRGCVAPWTRIYLPDKNHYERIDTLAVLGESIKVLSWTESGHIVSETAGAPFLKGYANYWKVSLDDGSSITVTDRHRFLTHEGWRRLADVRAGQLLASAPPALRPVACGYPAESPINGRHWSRTVEDSLADCRTCHRSCGPPPPPEAGTGRFPLPSPAGVDARIHPSSHMDDLAFSPGCSHRRLPSCPHAMRRACHPSALPQVWAARGGPFVPAHTKRMGPPASCWLFPEWSAQVRQAFEASSRPLGTSDASLLAELFPLSGPSCVSPLRPGGDAVESYLRSPRNLRLCAGLPPRPDIDILSPALAGQFVSPYLDNTTWAKVVSIQPAGFGPYYDLTVPGSENYLAEGVYNHNSGKSRSGAEWIVERGIQHPYDRSGAPTEHLVVAESLSEARKISIEGPSGILRVLERRQIAYHYTRSPKPKIILTDTGARIFFEGADNEDCGRGTNNASMLLDEIVTWKRPERVWIEGLMPSLRADIEGDHPRCLVTTTPKPIPLLREWLARKDGSVVIARGSTFDNSVNLSAHMLEEMRKRYEGTSLGRQELYGEMLDDMEGALFSQVDIAATRVDIGPEKVTFRVVAVDPSLTGDDDGDEMGVVVVSRDERDHMYVLEDASIRLVGREAALHCWRVFDRYQADVLVYENNLGHAWMEQVLTDAYRELQREGLFPEYTNPPLKPVRSFQGKVLRAEPVSMRYQQRKIHMVGFFPELEEQLVSWDPLSSRESPDRLDAFVHACRYLMEGEKTRATVTSPANYTVAALNPVNRRGQAYIRRV